jgi:transposase
LTTKIHAAVGPRGLPIRIVLTPGQEDEGARTRHAGVTG